MTERDASATAASWHSRFGLVSVTAEGACLTTAPGADPPDRVVVISLPDTGVIRAQLSGSAERCPGDVSGNEGVSFLLDAPELVPGALGVALLGDSSSVAAGRTDLDGDGVLESYRLCTSQEGVHVTVWLGEPSSGRRIWHAYHYLGYDVEPTCTEAESRADIAHDERDRR